MVFIVTQSLAPVTAVTPTPPQPVFSYLFVCLFVSLSLLNAQLPSPGTDNGKSSPLTRINTLTDALHQ